MKKLLLLLALPGLILAMDPNTLSGSSATSSNSDDNTITVPFNLITDLLGKPEELGIRTKNALSEIDRQFQNIETTEQIANNLEILRGPLAILPLVLGTVLSAQPNRAFTDIIFSKLFFIYFFTTVISYNARGIWTSVRLWWIKRRRDKLEHVVNELGPRINILDQALQNLTGRVDAQDARLQTLQTYINQVATAAEENFVYIKNELNEEKPSLQALSSSNQQLAEKSKATLKIIENLQAIIKKITKEDHKKEKNKL